jgi:RNA polymerase sigma-70 factor (ECF subfamily)
VVSPEEKEILLLLKRGDTSAIKILFEKYHAYLCVTAFRLLKNSDAAKDVVQEVFIKFWNNRDSIEITSSLSAYLKRSVINTSLNQIEKDQRHTNVEIGKLSHHPATASGDDGYIMNDLSQQLDSAIDKLPVRTRAVFLLIRREEMSYKEVSEALNISLKAVEKEMMKALRLLREMLKNLLPMVIFVPLFA